MTEDLCGALVLGLSINAACDLVGISEVSFHRYVRIGTSKGKGLEYDFCQSVRKALAKSRAVAMRAIHDAYSGRPEKVTVKRTVNPDGSVDEVTTTEKGMAPVWTAGAWKLERRWPKEYSAQRMDIAAAVSEQVDLALKKLVKAFGGPDGKHVDQAITALTAPDESLGVADLEKCLED